MHNIKDLRKNLIIFKKKFKDRNLEFDLEEFNNLDELNRKLIQIKKSLNKKKKLYLSLKIKVILINQKKFQRKFQF